VTADNMSAVFCIVFISLISYNLTMNLRKIVLASIALIIGIATSCMFQQYKILLLTAILSVLFVCFLFSSQRAKAVVFAIFLVTGTVVADLNIQNFHNNDINQSVVQVTGIVTDNTSVLRDCTIDGEKTEGKIRIDVLFFKTENNRDIRTGDKISFSCMLNDCFFDKDGMYVVDYKNDIRYFVSEIFDEVRIVEQVDVALDEKARLYVKDMLLHYLDEDTFGVAYAMVVGDKSFVDNDAMQSFRNAGIAHVFAISGLHVGFVVMLINAFVRKRKKLALFVTMPAILFYAYICNFSPSIMRAMLMTGVLLTAKAFGREPDMLASISTAVLFILFAKPLYLFDVGFQMSVGAVVGIDFITRGVQRLIKSKNKFLQKLSSLAAVSVGATLGTALFSIQYFGSTSVFSVLINIVLVPIVSAVYTLVVICLIFPIFFFAFDTICLCLKVLLEIAAIFAQLPLATLLPANEGIILYFVLLYILSGHCLLSAKKKVVFGVLSAVFLFLFAILNTLPKSETQLVVYETNGRTFCVTVDGKSYIFSNLEHGDMYVVENIVQGDVVVYVLDFDKFDFYNALKIKNIQGVDSVEIKSLTNIDYFDEDYINLNKHNIPTTRVKSDKNSDIKVDTLNYFEKLLAVTVEFDGHTFCYIPELTDFQKSYVLENMKGRDVYFCENMSGEIKEKFADSIVLTENFHQRQDIYSTYRFGNFTLKAKNDKLLYLEL